MKAGCLYFFVALIGGLIFQVMPYIGWGLEYLPGDLGDTRFNLFVLEHGKQFLLGEVQQYWSAGFMHPEPEVITLSDNLFCQNLLMVLYYILDKINFLCWLIV